MKKMKCFGWINRVPIPFSFFFLFFFKDFLPLPRVVRFLVKIGNPFLLINGNSWLSKISGNVGSSIRYLYNGNDTALCPRVAWILSLSPLYGLFLQPPDTDRARIYAFSVSACKVVGVSVITCR